MDEIRTDAEALLRSRRFGVLSTHSEDAPGYPFGSLASYAVDELGRPVFLFSGLAEHTQNAAADPRVSLTAIDAAAEDRPQTAPRVTVIGDLAPVPEEEEDAARALYLQRHPEAKGYSQFADFALYRLSVRGVYFVGGFGRAGWASRTE
ncbi:MAG: pyridoxamine 5'-phosphate oxidase family protein [Acidobacteria bacterium]|nr:pyridoxamine 5'-phosphate oxidase family protein [Acidobacteriota bacterium]